jgi:hypothetical protein
MFPLQPSSRNSFFPTQRPPASQTPAVKSGAVRLLPGAPKLALWGAGVSLALAGFALDAHLSVRYGKVYRDNWDL